MGALEPKYWPVKLTAGVVWLAIQSLGLIPVRIGVLLYKVNESLKRNDEVLQWLLERRPNLAARSCKFNSQPINIGVFAFAPTATAPGKSIVDLAVDLRSDALSTGATHNREDRLINQLKRLTTRTHL